MQPLKTEDIDMTVIENAIAVALEAHKGQKDKSGMPYILHPLRVMLTMETEEEMVPAVLHDVLEDSKIDEDYILANEIPLESINIINLLTKKNENYLDYIDRIKTDPIAVKIKKADIIDNLNILRLTKIDETDINRLNNYLKALKILEGVV